MSAKPRVKTAIAIPKNYLDFRSRQKIKYNKQIQKRAGDEKKAHDDVREHTPKYTRLHETI